MRKVDRLGVSMFKFLKKLFLSSDSNSSRRIPTVNIDAPQFKGLRPSVARISQILRDEEVIKPDHISWFANNIRAGFTNSSRSTLQTLVRDGELLEPDELRALGLRANRKIGRNFVERLSAADLSEAIDSIATAILFVNAEANMKFSLKQMDDVGLKYVTLCSPDDERQTEVEREFDGRKLTIAEAEELVLNHGREIMRSTFIADTDDLLESLGI